MRGGAQTCGGGMMAVIPMDARLCPQLNARLCLRLNGFARSEGMPQGEGYNGVHCRLRRGEAEVGGI